MRLFPRSLLWRTFLMITLLVIASQAAWIAILRVSEREPHARQIAQQVTSIVNLTRAALITAAAEKRLELLRELSQREGIRVYPAEHEELIIEPPDDPLLRMIAREVRRQLGPDTQIKLERAELRGVWVSFDIDDETYWVALPETRIEAQVPWNWIGWGVLSGLLALVGAWLIVSRINRPLRALTAAAARIGRGSRCAPVAESGATELRTLAKAFNQMSATLERADAERALLLAGVSHDLRTPLSRLRLGLEMLDGADSGLHTGMVQDIEDMDAIIEQFLDFARDDSGEALDPTADLNAIVGAVLERYTRRGKAVTGRLGALRPWPLRPMAIQRLVLNLVENALRYAGSPVEIETRLAAHDLELAVLDRGPGIPASERTRLMQPFTRLEVSRGGPGGAGLGLAIVQRIAALHHATVELLPRNGGGLEVRVRFRARHLTDINP